MPLVPAAVERRMKRWQEQRWILDNIIKTVGKAPKQLLLYQGERHGLHTTSSTALGPNPQTYIADWLRDRLDGRPMASQHMLVDMMGQVHGTAWEEHGQAR
jgi:hypothetical protein